MRFFKELHALIWTLSGTALVLITFTGQVLRYALWITLASLVAHIIGFLIIGSDEDEDDS